MGRRALAWALVLAFGAGCDSGVDSESNDVVVHTQTEAEWAQYVADVKFADGYVARCQRDPMSTRPRVIVTGFGRFLSNTENATGRMVSRFVPGLEYPLTSPPPEGEVDDPGAQLRVSQGVITLDGVGEVEVCGIVLPVFWDVASILTLKEAASFEPDLVLMNGIAGSHQPIWLELGALNEAVALPDGSGTLAPVESGTPLVPTASAEERARGNLLSWLEVRVKAEAAISSLAPERDPNGVAFGELVQGVRFAGYPRSSNTYLCNNTTFAVGYVMDHAGETVRLLEPSEPREGGPTGVDVSLAKDMSSVPRVFVHWPSALSGEHLDRGAAVMQAIIGAQLSAQAAATRGDAALADFTD
jgi:pyrrolidone-carboxylate peptidase